MNQEKTQSKYTPYKTAWDKTNTRHYGFKFNNNTDADIIAKLDSVPNRQNYIKELIRADLEKEKK